MRVQGTSSLACARQVQSKVGEGSGGLRWQFGSTQLQSLGSAQAASSVVVVPTPTEPMGIFKSTQDFKAPGAVKEHTNEVRGGGRDPGVKRPGAGLSLSPARSKFLRAAMLFLTCTSPAPSSQGPLRHLRLPSPILDPDSD